MEARRSYEWAQDKIEQVTHLTKDQRESQACARRLEQLRKRREKQEKRNSAKQENKS